MDHSDGVLLRQLLEYDVWPIERERIVLAIPNKFNIQCCTRFLFPMVDTAFSSECMSTTQPPDTRMRQPKPHKTRGAGWTVARAVVRGAGGGWQVAADDAAVSSVARVAGVAGREV